MFARPNTNDAAILEEVRHYFPDRIDYTAITVAVDIGAHIGGWSSFVKEKSPDAVVFAIEPDETNADVLWRNLHGKGVFLFYRARCGYEWRDVVLLATPGNTGGRSYIPRDQAVANYSKWKQAFGVDWVESDLPAITLEELLGGYTGAIDVLKIDAEGAEFDILLNAPLDTLRRCKFIVGEAHHLNGNFEDIAIRLLPYFDVQVGQGAGTFLFICERRN